MQVGIQTPEAVASLEKLNLADRSIDLPSIDPSVISPVLPVDPAWIRPNHVTFVSDAGDIDGVQISMLDITVSNTFTSSLEEQITDREQRFYSYLTVQFGGGTVSSIQVTISRFIPQILGYQSFLEPVIPNPGIFSFGPVYIPPGSSMRVRNKVNGGSGDSMYFAGFGFQAPAGVAMPLTPPLYISTT